MSAISLHCDCGAALILRAPDADRLIAAIDASGWRDRPTSDLCPKCRATYEEATP